MPQIKIKNTKPQLVVSIEGYGQISDFNKDVNRLYSYLYNKNLKGNINGPLIGLFYTEFGGRYIAAIPIKKEFPIEKEMKIFTLPSIKCISILHKGSYKTIEKSFDKLKQYLKEKRLKLSFPVREIYLNSSGPEEKYLTEIQIPLT